jgi:hypothetical protein
VNFIRHCLERKSDLCWAGGGLGAPRQRVNLPSCVHRLPHLYQTPVPFRSRPPTKGRQLDSQAQVMASDFRSSRTYLFMCSFRGTPSSMAVEKDPAPRARGAVGRRFHPVGCRTRPVFLWIFRHSPGFNVFGVSFTGIRRWCRCEAWYQRRPAACPLRIALLVRCCAGSCDACPR